MTPPPSLLLSWARSLEFLTFGYQTSGVSEQNYEFRAKAWSEDGLERDGLCVPRQKPRPPTSFQRRINDKHLSFPRPWVFVRSPAAAFATNCKQAAATFWTTSIFKLCVNSLSLFCFNVKKLISQFGVEELYWPALTPLWWTGTLTASWILSTSQHPSLIGWGLNGRKSL